MILTYSLEDYSTCGEEIQEISKAWWYESKFYKDWGMEFDLDINLAKGLFAIVGRDEDKKIAAYYVGFTTPYMFNPSVVAANEVAWHITPEHQGGVVFNELLTVLETEFTAQGVTLWNLCVPAEEKFDRVTIGLEKRGYKLQDRVYCKSISS